MDTELDSVSYLTINDETREIVDKQSRNNISELQEQITILQQRIAVLEERIETNEINIEHIAEISDINLSE